MKLSGFLKKLIQRKNEKQPEIEKLSILNLEIWIENKIKDIKFKEKNIINSIFEEIKSFSDKVNEKMNSVKEFDLNLKKEDDRIKSIVEEGRKKYLESIEYFLYRLNNLNKENLEKIISEIDTIFSDLSTKSEKSYQRATVLIGKEMAELKKVLEIFSKELIIIFKENKETLEFHKTILLIKSRLKSFERIQEEIEKTEEEIDFLGNKIIEREKEHQKIIHQINIIKKSPEYLKKQKHQEEIDFLINNLEKDILNLKQAIDFKALGNFYHIFENEMQVVKNYRDNFQSNFHKSNGKEILNLLETAHLTNQIIVDKINQIKAKKEEIQKLEIKVEIENKKYQNEKSYLINKKIMIELDDLKNKKFHEEKKLVRFKEDRERMIDEVKGLLKKLKVELV